MNNTAVIKAVRNMIQRSDSIECRGSLFATKSRCSNGSFFHAEVVSYNPSVPNLSGVRSVSWVFASFLAGDEVRKGFGEPPH